MGGALALIAALAAAPARASDLWPDLSRPAAAVGGGEEDAGVVVGIEGYGFVPPVPGAELNAKAWYDYLTRTRGVAPGNVKLLLGVDAERDDMLDAAQAAASKAGPRGTLWFVFVGHGAPSADGKDGLLVGVDAQQKAKSLQKRSLKRQELLAALAKSRAGSISVILDACFSGRGQDGDSIVPGLQPLVSVAAAGASDPRMVVLTAAQGDQFAGALPGTNRPAFSYLALGALRGWAAGKEGRVTAGDVWRYATQALDATLRGRNQTPDLMGKEGAVVGVSAGEKGPDLAALAKATAGGAIAFNVSALPEVPRANQPSLGAVGRLPRPRLPGAMGQAEGIDFSAVDVDALGKYDAVVTFEKGQAPPESKAAKWRALGAEVKTYADLAAKRAGEWDDYAAQAAFNSVLENDKGESSPEDKAARWGDLAWKYPKYRETARSRVSEWERYAKELAAAAAAKDKRDELMGKDWSKLEKLLSYSVVSEADKQKFALTFVSAYGKTSEDNPYVAELAAYLPAGTVKVTPGVKAAASGRAGIQWVRIPGGTFSMGADDLSDAWPRHSVTLKSFQMAKTEVTNKQYKACVEAGACTPPGSYEGAPEQPVVNVDWNQAKAFSEWVGGRLPSEAEWEYAARSAGKDWKYPWGNEDATCERAVIADGGHGCGKNSTWPVCSKAKGNTAQGLCDMAGNVWEWTQDWYHRLYEGAPTDGSAWERPAGSYRVVRGCSWYDDAGRARSAVRSRRAPDNRGDVHGFRPSR